MRSLLCARANDRRSAHCQPPRSRRPTDDSTLPAPWFTPVVTRRSGAPSRHRRANHCCAAALTDASCRFSRRRQLDHPRSLLLQPVPLGRRRSLSRHVRGLLQPLVGVTSWINGNSTVRPLLHHRFVARWARNLPKINTVRDGGSFAGETFIFFALHTETAPGRSS